jgi:hypothetical protein
VQEQSQPQSALGTLRTRLSEIKFEDLEQSFNKKITEQIEKDLAQRSKLNDFLREDAVPSSATIKFSIDDDEP